MTSADADIVNVDEVISGTVDPLQWWERNCEKVMVWRVLTEEFCCANLHQHVWREFFH